MYVSLDACLSICLYVCNLGALGQILAGGPLEANFGNLKALGPAIEIPFWDPWETALLGQILAGGSLEANFGNLRALGPAIKIPFWDPWETALLGQNALVDQVQEAKNLIF